MAEPIDFSKTQRIVLLIDLNPLLHLQNPSPYITSILTASRILLTFSSLSTSLFAFKLFFSSLSPLRSSSALHRLIPKPSALSLSFNDPPETLISLTATLNSLSISTISPELASLTPRASHTASLLVQLVHDYAWESQNENPSGTLNNFPIVRSNLIILLSPIPSSFQCLSEFMNLDINDEALRQIDAFSKRFDYVFAAVNDAYVDRDIHFSWIDIKDEFDCKEDKNEVDEPILQLGLFENGIRRLGWGFCSTDSIVLGSALIPFGLIYPRIGISFNFLNSSNLHKRVRAQLGLEISDVSGKPLECKCCDLELLNISKSSGIRYDDIMHSLELRNSESEGFDQFERCWGHFSDGIIKLHVMGVKRYGEGDKTKLCSHNHILVRGMLGETGKSKKKCSSGFFADMVLELLSRETGEFILRETPIWQILLSFLHREGLLALVSFSNGNGDSCMGILKPFTECLALLSIIENQNVHSSVGLNFAKIGDEICKSHADMNNLVETVDSQLGASSSRNNMSLGDGKRKKNEKHLQQDLTWSSFHKAAFECSELELEKVYFAIKSNNSKKLKFLKCWMKQVKKSSYCCLTIPDGSKSHQHVTKEIDQRLAGTNQESERPVTSTRSCRTQQSTAFLSRSETSEAFFSDLPKKIQQGLESEGVDLQILAERLVNLTIYWLYQKHETDNSVESQTPVIKSDDTCGGLVAAELIKLVLRDPRELKESRMDNDPSFQPYDTRSTSLASDNIVREYELQILLRMEILRSEVAQSIEESVKKKLLKQICSLLEIIQYLLEGGCHGHVSLYDYVERAITSRYCHTLEDVIVRIQAQMDFLPFGDENDSPNLLLNSEDSNQSWRHKSEREEMGETNKIHESISVEDESSQPTENNEESPQRIKREEHARKLIEAKERRERARRFGSFTSWVPDLQRVWAPKQQPRAMGTKSESLRKQCKRRERRRASYDVVCETPLTGRKRSCPQGSSIGDPSSVSKALFQDNM
ncbi:uncharacterized protein LOC132271690 [Cornus florida]|uniref:uncharacterized protein LOC132271690 n=1 Tax=Cornus florida TaxID=4283 RepID=UPI0028984CAF|nr:uncharacterized protein LOC132271690 [Cornus florida]